MCRSLSKSVRLTAPTFALLMFIVLRAAQGQNIGAEDRFADAKFVAPGAFAQIPSLRRMVGEFEHQAALMVAWDASDFTTRDVLVSIAEHSRHRLPLLILVKDQADHADAFDVLGQRSLLSGRVRFVRMPVDSPWTRDYGPTIVRCYPNAPLMIDAVYETDVRPNDDRVPAMLGETCRCRIEGTGLRIEGGNLLGNGDGLAIVTERLIEQNTAAGFTVQETLDRLRTTYGLDRVITLMPLEGESTGHVDMFATFTSTNTVVIGQCDVNEDPINADVLDQNADALAGLPTSDGPLTVVRIPMPKRIRSATAFPTWTNVVFANRTLLMPGYPEVDPVGERVAIETFQRLLPDWTIRTIDCNGVIEAGGALHCLALNLPSLPVLPLSPRVDEFDAVLPLPLPFPEDIVVDRFSTPTGHGFPRPMFQETLRLTR